MSVLDEARCDFLAAERRGVLVTIDPDGRPRPVPVCFALVDGVIYSPLDEKPKRVSDPRALARVHDLRARPEAVFLVDRWSEDWTQLAWLRVEVTGLLLEPGEPEHAPAIAALRDRYPQYRSQRLEASPLLRLDPIRAVDWSAARPGP
ncbi:MAG: pyridoxamine 5'-phosphate oxidase family protein [Candidatus Limnocylindrales bacterium]